MAFIINGEKYTLADASKENFWRDVYTDFITLPKPEIVDKPNAVIVSSFEGEVVESYDQDLGTENVGGCIALYLYGGGKRLLIHVNDGVAPLELDKRLARFPINCEIKTVLVGGSLHERDSSDLNISHIMKEFLHSTRDITIVSQALFDRQAKTLEAELTAIYDDLIKRFMYFYKHLYNENMPSALLWRLSPNCFRNQVKWVSSRERLVSMCNVVTCINHLLDPAQAKEVIEGKARVGHNFITRTDFLLHMREIISLEGLKILSEIGYIDTFSGAVDLGNLFFHHGEDGEVMVGRMNPFMKKTFGPERAIHMYKMSNVRTHNHYFDAYRDGVYFPPPFDLDFRKNIVELQKLLKDRVRTPEVMDAVVKITGNLTDYHLSVFTEAVSSVSFFEHAHRLNASATFAPVSFSNNERSINEITNENGMVDQKRKAH